MSTSLNLQVGLTLSLLMINQNLLLDLSDSWHHVETLPIESTHIPNKHRVTATSRIQAHHGSRYRDPVPDLLLPGPTTHHSTAIYLRFEIMDTLWYMHTVPERPKKEAHIPPENLSMCLFNNLLEDKATNKRSMEKDAKCEPASTISHHAPNSYCIIQEKGAIQPRIHTRSNLMLKIRSLSEDLDQKCT